ncbi:hypothetical protein M404DRAFT_24964 [Pisolithus tinctorius Marx 270]|uniref:DNA-directed RNA polymerase n=1 Tax=Pisolithus tinctorius Marx 270 TaxID=870435 RepID=A0A0C3PDK3_PISTI|nr:hypothetical protein M404DRAFT_24964 [Pisolithus tinctorius Marx 270]
MAYVASRITENFEMHLFTTWSVPGVHQVFLLEHDKMYANDEVSIKTRKEWALETDSANLKVAMCVPGVGFNPMYLNNCIESFATLRVEAMCATIMKELRGAFEFDSSYVSYHHLALPCDLLTHHRMLMAITCHSINYPDTGALMHCSFEEMVEILMEAAAIGENNDCHSITKKVMFSQLVPMGTGAFNITLDINIFKDAIINHRLPVQNILTAHMNCSMTPSQVAMMLYDTNSPAWSESNFKSESVALSPLAINSGEDPANFSFLGYGKSPLGAGDMSPTGPPGNSLSSPNAYSPTLPYKPRGYITNILPDVTCSQSHVSLLFTNQSTVQSATAFLQSHISMVLTNWPILCLQDIHLV